MSRVVVLRVGALLLALASWAATGVVLAATVGVTVGNYYFEDATVGDGVVTARVGDQLRFTVVDTGTDGRPHTADVDELGIHSGGLPPGSTWTSPAITQPGTFLLYCKVHLNSKNHKTTLVVSGTAVAPTATPSRATAGPATLTPTALASVPAAPSGSLRPGASTVGSPGASGVAASSGGIPSQGPASSGGPGSSGSPAGVVPDGGAVSPPSDWGRSVRLGLGLLLPIVLVALFASRVATARTARAVGDRLASDPGTEARPRV